MHTILNVLIALFIWQALGFIKRVIVAVYLDYNPSTKKKLEEIIKK